MSKTAFIYPGTGRSESGMGKDFYENSELARYIFDTATESLDLDMTNFALKKTTAGSDRIYTGSHGNDLSCNDSELERKD